VSAPRQRASGGLRAEAWDAGRRVPDSANIEVVRRAFEAFSRRDVEALVAACSPDIEFHLPTAQLARVGVPYRGHEGVRTYMRDVARVWAELRLEPREYRENGDAVVAIGRVYAWGAGRVVDTPAAWVWRLRDGLAVRVDVYENAAEALEASGLREV
jgi:ketosteroid isomerase-like protein